MTNCPICEAKETTSLLKWKVYKIHKCASCKLVFTTPLPSDDELQSFYQGFMFNTPASWEIDKAVKKKQKELIRLFDIPVDRSNLGGKKILDYGGGTGIAYHVMNQLGFDTYYHDLDNNAIEFTKKQFGMTDDKIIPNINQSDITFDYIFSDNVIEHVKSPIDFTNELCKKLNQKGKLVIKTPLASNTETIFNPIIFIKGYFLGALKYNSFFKSFRALLNGFWSCDPPRHLYAFSAKSLNALVDKLETGNIKHEILYYKIPLFENTLTKQFFTKDKRLSGLKSILMRILILPILPIEITLQLTKELLLFLKILTPGGIILKLVKE